MTYQPTAKYTLSNDQEAQGHAWPVFPVKTRCQTNAGLGVLPPAGPGQSPGLACNRPSTKARRRKDIGRHPQTCSGGGLGSSGTGTGEGGSSIAGGASGSGPEGGGPDGGGAGGSDAPQPGVAEVRVIVSRIAVPFAWGGTVAPAAIHANAGRPGSLTRSRRGAQGDGS